MYLLIRLNCINNTFHMYVEVLGMMAIGAFTPKNALTRWTSMLTTASRNKREKKRTEPPTNAPKLLVRIDQPSPVTNAMTPLATSTQAPMPADPDQTTLEAAEVGGPVGGVEEDSEDEDPRLLMDMHDV
jgi:hypothetical protein